MKMVLSDSESIFMSKIHYICMFQLLLQMYWVHANYFIINMKISLLSILLISSIFISSIANNLGNCPTDVNYNPPNFIGNSRHSQFRSLKRQVLKLGDPAYHRNNDGSGNNINNPNMNAVNTTFRRLGSVSYEDAKDIPISTRPHPRSVSNIVGEQPPGPITPNRLRLTALFTFWGQFTDHDLTLGLPQNGPDAQVLNITIPAGDPFFTTQTVIPFSRTQFQPYTPRQQKNSLTGWLDGSQIYGSDPAVAANLRTFQKGKLKSSGDNLLSHDATCVRFKQGDIRVNQNLALLTLHTLMNRQHNRLCDQILKLDNSLTDDQVYQIARNYLIGVLQKITFEDWLPHLLGPEAWNRFIGEYPGYDSSRDARIPNEFSNAAFRIGHPLLVPNYPQYDKNGNIIESFTLVQLFERADLVNNQRINIMLRSLPRISAKEKQRIIINDVRNFLFLQDQVSIKLDLFSLNLMRARDHGLLDYNSIRTSLGLSNYNSFSDLTSDADTIARLQTAYGGDLSKLDPWVGVICQDPNYKGVLGELGSTIVGTTFRDIRAGDRFWYENYMDYKLIKQIKQTTLGDIILRNTDIKRLPNGDDSVFLLCD